MFRSKEAHTNQNYINSWGCLKRTAHDLY